jgi:hypothetical protein
MFLPVLRQIAVGSASATWPRIKTQALALRWKTKERILLASYHH